jgi:hypothetical protein
MPIPGRCYRNGAGQVRRFIGVDEGHADFIVVLPGPGGAYTSQYPAGHRGRMAINSFRQWLVQECDETGAILSTPGLRPPKPRTDGLFKRLKLSLAESVV